MTRRFLHTHENGSESTVDFTEDLYWSRVDHYKSLTGPQLGWVIRRLRGKTAARDRMELNAAERVRDQRRRAR